ncbi:MAG: hypothetical protein IJI57_15580 [Flexilinea sp.]|nr:hypothetical protein [Flexilinea sp.]
MDNVTSSTAVLTDNPYIIDLRQLVGLAFFMLLAGILIMLVLKIILDFRKYHYK